VRPCTGTDGRRGRVERAKQILTETRRQIYRLLAEDDG
jgi:hypothetical protein